ncbi:DUF6766 family protein [Steroidobacter cummioxidans]|uniref:DUF6766 family protein n=1 Tax=Steroidobacter cummioxidans TaxID=1803913 RepID=UPI000E321692|nr:DUF6766 family protein [Steroidobacter cummioxidans]
MKRFWRDNGLSLVLFALFLIFWAGQALTGWRDQVADQRDHGATPPTLVEYLSSGDFVEATTENWESEFLQMFAFVLFTAFLYQRGSAESKSPDEPEEVDRDPRLCRSSDAPGPVQAGGWRLRLYEHSLSLAFLILFLISFISHAVGGAAAYNEEQRLHGGTEVSFWEFLTQARFWFQSFQNWQSEFLAIWCMVVLTIFLRQRGSAESKPVDSPHNHTGG